MTFFKTAYTPLFFSLIFALLMSFNAASADETVPEPDESKPIEVVSNSLDATEKEGKSIYRGAVVITQGTTVITGDVVTLLHPNSELSEAISKGNPATFKRYSFEQQKWMTGHAQEITYNAQLKTLLFKGKAQVEQAGENSIQGPEIFYDLTHKTLSAKGSAQKSQRIKVIFTPEKKPVETDNPQQAQP